MITGAGGGLGSRLAELLPSAAALARAELSIDDEAAVRRAVAANRPSVLFNCAAYNAVDKAESSPEPAMAVNARGPGVLAAVCREAGVRLVHFSTNYVFSGEAASPYTEEDAPDPLSVYGRSKLAGERAVLDRLPDALVVRSAGLYGPGGSAVKGGTFPERIMRRARAGEPLSVVDDQWLNPTFTVDLAARAVELAFSGMSGVVHLVAAGCCTWREFAVEVLAAAGVEAQVAGASTASLNAAAPRPRQGCLESVRVGPLRSWPEAVRAWLGGAAAAEGPGGGGGTGVRGVPGQR